MTEPLEVFAEASGARLSDDGKYRYALWRDWNAMQPRLTVVMLNPSTADANHDDPTIRRVRGFAQREGFGGMEVVNLFAYRATDPRQLDTVDDPVGPENHGWLAAYLGQANTVLAAWGASALDRPRGYAMIGFVHSIATRRPLQHLGLTGAGEPRHPLYVRADQPFADLTTISTAATQAYQDDEDSTRRAVAVWDDARMRELRG